MIANEELDKVEIIGCVKIRSSVAIRWLCDRKRDENIRPILLFTIQKVLNFIKEVKNFYKKQEREFYRR